MTVTAAWLRRLAAHLEEAAAELETKRATGNADKVNRILWNIRGGDIDEIVFHDAIVHVEQMHDRCWWIGITLPDDGYWAGNFHCDSRGRMTFTEQESWGFDWNADDSHEATR